MSKDFNNGLVAGYALAKGVVDKPEDETDTDVQTIETNEGETSTQENQ